MTCAGTSQYREQLLIEQIAEALRFDQVAERLPIDVPPSYLLVATALTIQIGVLDSYNYFIADKNSLVDDPGRLIVLFGTIVAVVGVRWMRDKYAEAMVDLKISQRNNTKVKELEDRITYIVPHRTKIVISASAVIILYLNLFLNLGFWTMVEINGLVRVIMVNLLILPFIQIPLIVEFALMYFSIHFVLPRYIAKADFDLFFYDPRNMGGFASIGDLLKQSYYLYTACLLLYFFFVYWPTILISIWNINPPVPEPGIVEAVFFSSLWLLGVISIGYSMYRIHSVMSRKKEEAIVEIENDIREILDDPFGVNAAYIEDKETREEFQHRLAEVRGTNEYPSTFTMWSQIAISVILPQALQLTIQIFP